MKRKFKLIVPSFVAILVSVLLIAGSTFALFTSQVTNNLVVSSGKVDLKANLTDLVAYSAEAYTPLSEESLDEAEAGVAEEFGVRSHYRYVLADNNAAIKVFSNKGTAQITTEKSLVLDKATPGDKVTLKLELSNEETNVDILYRVRLNALSSQTSNPKLLEALEITVGEEHFPGVVSVGAWKLWKTTDADEKEIDLAVVLPIDVGNIYQDLSVTLRFTIEAVQANAAVDELLDQVNEYLANKTSQSPNKNATMYDALQEVKANSAFAAFDGTKYLWSPDTDQFYNLYTIEEGFESYFFKAYTKDELAELNGAFTYNIYAVGDWANADLSHLTVGFDAGNATNVPDITYDRHDAQEGKEVIIRTNSASTNLTVDAEKDVLYRYGVVGTVTINSIAGNSYHEYGKAEYVEIATGRIALETGSSVKVIHLIANENADGFEPIVVSKESTVVMPQFERDPIAIDPENGTFVVELQSDTNNDENTESDYVWLTAVGVYEQVTFGTQDEAGENYAINANSEKATQKVAAQQIANNISTTIDSTEYSVHAEKDLQGEWTYKLKAGETPSDYVVNSVVVEQTTNNNVVTSIATVTVAGAETEATTINNNTNDTSSAKAKAVSEVLEGAVVYNQTKEIYYNAGAGKTYSTDKEALFAAMNAADANNSLVLLKDISLNEYLGISKSLTINGNNHTLLFSASRTVRVTTDNVNVRLQNITIDGNNVAERGVQVDSDKAGVSLNLNNVVIQNITYYGINICSGTKGNIEMDGCTVTAWGAINLWSADYDVVIKNSHLNGVNDKGFNKYGWNDFATIVLEGDTTKNTELHASDINVRLINTTITATSTTNNKQALIGFNTQSKANTVSLENCTLQLNGIYTYNYYDNGTDNKLLINNSEINVDEYFEDYIFNTRGCDAYISYFDGSNRYGVYLELHDVLSQNNLYSIRLGKDVSLSQNYELHSAAAGNNYILIYLQGHAINQGDFTLKLTGETIVITDSYTSLLSLFSTNEGYHVVEATNGEDGPFVYFVEEVSE